MGIAALVLGIIALLGSWIPILNNLSAIIAVVGLVFGLLAIRSTRPAGKKSGRGLSIAGTVICALAFAIVLFTQYVFSSALNKASESLKESAPAAATTTTQNQSEKKDEKTEGALTVDKYLIENVQVKKVGTDYNGNATVLVSYDMTNNGDKGSNALDLTVKVFQNKAALDTAMYTKAPEGYDSGSLMKEIQPGGKKTVTLGYVLTSETDPVTVEIRPTLSLDKNAAKFSQEFPLS